MFEAFELLRRIAVALERQVDMAEAERGGVAQMHEDISVGMQRSQEVLEGLRVQSDEMKRAWSAELNHLSHRVRQLEHEHAAKTYTQVQH